MSSKPLKDVLRVQKVLSIPSPKTDEKVSQRRYSKKDLAVLSFCVKGVLREPYHLFKASLRHSYPLLRLSFVREYYKKDLEKEYWKKQLEELP